MNGQTYSNACEADCEGAELSYDGECDAAGEGGAAGDGGAAGEGGSGVLCECACPEVYDPVCGVNGQTYDNACQAECEGADIGYDGECELDGAAPPFDVGET